MPTTRTINPPYLTAKQVAALNRSFDRNGESPLRVGECRKVSKGVQVCRVKQGIYLASRRT